MKLTRCILLLALVPAMMVLGTGCGGIQASRSISPLDFFLPGLLQNKPAEEKKKEQTEVIAALPPGGQLPAVAQAL